MPFFDSINGLFSKSISMPSTETSTKSKLPTAVPSSNTKTTKTTKTTTIPIPTPTPTPPQTPTPTKEKRCTIKQIAIPEPPPNRTHGRFTFDETGSQSPSDGTGSSPNLNSSTSLSSTASRGSGSFGSGSGSSSGESFSRKRFSGVSKGSSTSGGGGGGAGAVSQRGSWGDGDGDGDGVREEMKDREGEEGEEGERTVLFLRNNALLDSRRGKEKMRLVMDERSYTSLPPSPSPSPSPYPYPPIDLQEGDYPEAFEQEQEPEPEPEPQTNANANSKIPEPLSYASNTLEEEEGTEIDLTNLSKNTNPEILSKLLTSFHADIRQQNRWMPFSSSQITAVEEFLSYASTLALLGSNNIEGAGVRSFEIVRRVCKEVFYATSSNFAEWCSTEREAEVGIVKETPAKIPVESGEVRGSVDSGIGVSIAFGSVRGDQDEEGENEEKGKGEEKRALKDIVRGGLYDFLLGPSEPRPQLHLHPYPYPRIPSTAWQNSTSKRERGFPHSTTDPEVAFTPAEITTACDELLSAKGKNFTYADLVRAEREVVQHALAWRYLVRRFVVGGEVLSEEMVKEAHEILMRGIPPPDLDMHAHTETERDADPEANGDGDGNGRKEVGWEKYAGVYRTADVSAGFTAFAYPFSIPRKMKYLVRGFDRAVKEAEREGTIDPVALAAEFCHRLVNIHPFLDGNGRIARLFMNAILLRYLGIVAPFGADDDEQGEKERDVYLGIAARASLAQLQRDDDGDNEDGDEEGSKWGGSQKPWAELVTFVLGKYVAIVEGVWDVLGDEDVVGVVPGWEEVLVQTYLGLIPDCEEGVDVLGEKEGDWEDDVLGCYFESGSESESDANEVAVLSTKEMEGEGKTTRIVWPNPPPRKRHPHLDVLKPVTLPAWVTERAKDAKACCDVGGDASSFSIFEGKAASLMTRKGFVAPRMRQIGPQWSEENE